MGAMRSAAIVISVLVVLLGDGGCGGSRQVGTAGSGAGTGSSGGGGGMDGALPIAQHNEVCYARDRETEEGRQVAVCAEGLGCCYPCGIPGCDSVCHTAEECRMDEMRP